MMINLTLAKLESDNQRRLGSAVSSSIIVHCFAVLGFGSPVFFQRFQKLL